MKREIDGSVFTTVLVKRKELMDKLEDLKGYEQIKIDTLGSTIIIKGVEDDLPF